MPYQPFLIAPLKSGIQTNRKPWLIADDAYQLLQNVYCWRGMVKKRIGACVMDISQPIGLEQQFTRLRILLKNTDGVGDAAGNLIADIGLLAANLKVGMMFSIGNDYYTVNVLGTPADMLSTRPATLTHTINTTTGDYNFVDAPINTPVYFYPALPVQHFGLYQLAGIDTEITIAFDTQFSYQYTNGAGWNRSGTTTQGLWTGDNTNFHTSANFYATEVNNFTLFVVNYKAADGIQYISQTAPNVFNWFTMPSPVTNAAGDTITTALIVFVFKERLLLFNTQEVIAAVPQTFPNRIRISQNGDPLQVDAWRDDIEGKGDFIDAPTNESITAVQSLKDRLIVFFENSTYELVYTNNSSQPFVLQKINTELGVESTHSIIPFDKNVLGMGSTGLHSCNGLNVERIDELIPQEVFDISNINDGPARVHGIRDYYEEMVYWTFPSVSQQFQANNVYPNRLLAMDYVNQTWAYHDDSITTFGYFFLPNNVLIWQNVQLQWNQLNTTWDAGDQYELFRSIIAGNQQGWTFIMEPDTSRNCMSLQITDITVNANNVILTVIDHNINTNNLSSNNNSSYVYINNIQSTGTLINLNNTIQEAIYISGTQIQINVAGLNGVYAGGGTLERVSEIYIQTKQYNFFPQAGRNCFLAYADFYVDATDSGVITVNYTVNDSDLLMISSAQNSGALLGTGILETFPYPLVPFEAEQNQLWHRVYFQQDGNVVQLVMYWTEEQIMDLQSIENPFVLNAIQYWAQPTAPYVW